MSLVTIDAPIESNNSPVFGIDFGTTNSLAALCMNGENIIIPDEFGNALIPSVVSVSKGKIVVGTEAKKLDDSVFSVKSLLGRNLKSFTKRYPFVDLKDDLNIALHGTQINILQIAAEIFKKLKSNVNNHLNIDLERAVITVPAYFDNSSRNAIKDSAKIAGIDIVRLLSEPTSAAFFYGISEKKDHGNYIVYDLGGGTFDVSLLSFHRGILKVDATGGDDLLGGDDFDNLLSSYLIDKYKIEDLDNNDLKCLFEASRLIKENLNTSISHTNNPELYRYTSTNGSHYNFSVSTDEFDDLISNQIDKTVDIVLSVLKRGDKVQEEIDGVLLVGGSSRIKLIRRRLSKIFNSKKIFSDISPDTIVVKGASLYASHLSGANSDDKTIVLDILPLSIGIETMGGIFEKIMLRDTPIPFKESQTFTNYYDGQTSFKIHVAQGEREFIKDNRSLAEFTLKNIPPLPSGKARIEINFEVNEDGILTVSAVEKTRNIKQEVEVNPSYGLTRQAVEDMILDSYEYGKQDIEKKMLVERIDYARKVIEIIESAITEDATLLQKEKLTEIRDSIDNLKVLIKGENYEDINRSIDILERIADPFLKKRLSKLVKDMKLQIK